MRNETKATKIPRAVKLAVWSRDGYCCVNCGAPGLPEAHIVRRSQGGLGIEKNVVTLCRICHREMDEGRDSKIVQDRVIKHIKQFYPDWDRNQCIYKKGDSNDQGV